MQHTTPPFLLATSANSISKIANPSRNHSVCQSPKKIAKTNTKKQRVRAFLVRELAHWFLRPFKAESGPGFAGYSQRARLRGWLRQRFRARKTKTGRMQIGQGCAEMC